MGATWFSRFFRHPLEGAAVWVAFAVFRSIPIDRASTLGGWIARKIGPHLSVNKVATNNLCRAFPELEPDEIAAIALAMWDNLGRVAAEFAHLDRIDFYRPDGPVEVVGEEHVAQVLKSGQGGIYFSAHLGNWEIASLSVTQKGVPLTHIYRAANNPYVERIVQRQRGAIDGIHHPKGATGGKAMVAALKGGKHLAMLADQKLNDGIPVKFFGREAMTAPSMAQLALRFRCPLVPARVERLRGARFRVTLFPPMNLPDTGDKQADVHTLMEQVNALIESWIRERPEQWLWVHRRWPD